MAGAKMFVGLIVLGVFGSAISQEFHEDLTPEELAKFFPMAGTKVPEYEIIPIHKSRLQKRDINGGMHLQLQAFGRDIILWLNPLDGVLASYSTPVYLIQSNFKLTPVPNLMRLVVPKMYKDNKNAATMHINKLPNGNIQLNGIIGSNDMYIKPLPDEYFIYPRRNRRSINNIPEAEFGNYTFHIAYKLSEEPEHMKTIENPFHNSSRSKRSNVDTIYPEILAIIDYPLYQKMEHNLYYAIGYILAFFNGVDLKYRSLQNPQFRLNIAGIIIATEPDALEYTNYRMPYWRNDLNVDNALKASETWLGKLGQKIYPNTFDAAITLTSQVFCLFKGKNDCERGTIGYAHVKLSCRTFGTNERPARRNSGLVHDEFDFEGIRTTAHELAHLFGVTHDGERYNQYCHADQGHIMTPNVRYTKNGSEWSYCSLREFENFLRQEPTCLYNKPKNGEPISRFLPGQLMDANQQCRKYLGTNAAVINDEICTQLKCMENKNSKRWIGLFEAAEGTSCGEGKICLHSQCVHESQINLS